MIGDELLLKTEGLRLTDLHARSADFTTIANLRFRAREKGHMLRAWMELTSISAAESALRRSGSREHLIDRSR
jgi:hypothetical protein